jgi:two-component system, OmpR family, sensor histidine kinase MprB
LSLRLKIVLALTALAAAATAAIGIASYASTKRSLESAVDHSLADAAQHVQSSPALGDPDTDGDGTAKPGSNPSGRPRSFEQVLLQVIDSSGVVVLQPTSGALPVGSADKAVAASSSSSATATHDVEIDGEPFRVYTVKFGTGAAQLARSLKESQDALQRILQSTLLAVLVVALTSMLLGWLIALQVTRRLERLTLAAGEVASTGRLDVEVPVDGSDETGQLGRAFSGMLDALQRSKQEQQQLVQDAGHELRTPLTSLRTNVSVLRRRFDNLTPDARDQLLGDLDSETRELTDLVNELVELATDGRDDEHVQPVRLADVAERAAARARRRFGRDVVVRADETVIDGRPNALERALQNLVDNACKFAPEGAVEVTVAGGTVVVRDHGPGLVAADVPHLFDRFFRSVQMRSKPGSGLGLAIVKSIVEGHGGVVFAGNADGGGARLGFTLPVPTAH